ncbi:MAG: IclR family transcriptional regulator [Microthrixaceae bacterium]
MSVLVKAAQIVDVLLRNSGPTKLGTLASEVQLPKSSIHRLLAELVELGVARRGEDGDYRPGYRLVQWGHAADRALGLRAAAEPLMRELSATVGESLHLHVPEGTQRVCMAAVDGPHTLRPVIHLGQVMPLGRGAAGKVLLAYAGSDVRQKAWELADERTRTRWPDPATLEEIRDRGWAKSVAEMEPGLTAISAAVPTRTGGALAALTVSGSTARMSDERCEELLPDLLGTVRQIGRMVAG